LDFANIADVSDPAPTPAAQRPQAPRPGRKRSENSRLAILAAAFALVGDVGYRDLTIEGIAARAGTGKQTIYRWWPTKADVLLDALATKADLYIPVPDAGDYPAEVRAFLSATFAMGRDRRVVDALRALMAHAQLDDAFRARFRVSFLLRRRDALATILNRADERGELPDGLTASTAADIVFGVIWYRILTSPDPVDLTLIDELVSVLTKPGGGRAPAQRRAKRATKARTTA
jgi:AcrR family transcriptional regulator